MCVCVFVYVYLSVNIYGMQLKSLGDLFKGCTCKNRIFTDFVYTLFLVTSIVQYKDTRQKDYFKTRENV